MQSIGIRELRQQASRYLRRVERGETIVSRRSRVEHLAASGRLVPATGDFLELGEPLEPAPQAPLPSEALAAARADER